MRTWPLFLFQDFQIHILGKLQYLKKDTNINIENINTTVPFIVTCTRTKGQMSKAIEATTEAVELECQGLAAYFENYPEHYHYHLQVVFLTVSRHRKLAGWNIKLQLFSWQWNGCAIGRASDGGGLKENYCYRNNTWPAAKHLTIFVITSQMCAKTNVMFSLKLL